MYSAESSPSSELDFTTEFATNYETAWDVAPARKARKQYGKTNSQKKEARHRKPTLRRIKSELLDSDDPTLRRLDLIDYDDGPAPFHQPLLETFSLSSLSSEFSINRPSIPSQSRGRSKSATAASMPRNMMKRYNSMNTVSAASMPHNTMKRNHSLNTFRRSSSSTLNSDFEFEHENVNPNVFSREGVGLFASPGKLPRTNPRAPLSTMVEHLKPRPRKIRVITDVGGLQRTFSDLAKDPNATTGWDDATPTNVASLVFDLDGCDTSSPHGSVATISSRKRGVCDSMGFDGCSSDVSSQGAGSRRSRTKSRSRIYSPSFAPMLESVKSLNDATKKLERRKQADIDSDDGVDNDSDDGMLSDDKSCESTGFEYDGFNSKAAPAANVSRPPRTIRRSSSNNFEESVFGAARTLETKVLSNEGIVQSMPSVEDLKFLIKNLRKSKKGAATTFGKITTWTVSLPSQWPSERRAKVLHWSTQDLGFSMRTGGPSVVFLNIASSRAPELLSQLESAFSFHREANPKSVKSKPSNCPRSIIFQKRESPIIFQKRESPLNIQPRGFRKAAAFDALDDDLVQAVNGLDLSAPDPSPEQSGEGSASLVRHVTLDPHHGRAANAQPRHSGEHFIGGKDLVSHMYGVSPRRCRARLSSSSRPSTGRRPRLSIDTDYRCAVSSPFVGSTKSLTYQHPAVETPHMTRRACWERPKNGRDWGATARCPDHVLRDLTTRFEGSLAMEGLQSEDSSSSLFEAAVEPASLCIDRSMEEVDEESESASNDEDPDAFYDDVLDLDAPPQVENRRSSVGATFFAGLNLNELNSVNDEEKVMRRRIGSMAKHKRVSLCANTVQTHKPLRLSRSSYFSSVPRLSMMESTLTLTDCNRFSFVPLQAAAVEEMPELVIDETVLADSKILLNVLSFLDEKELLCRSSPVCTLWADVSTEAHAALMLASVGCTESLDACDDDLDDEGEVDMANASIMQSMEQSWQYLVNQYPWACFLSEGAFKRVYKVWNESTKAEEALSVMDIELIESTGNKNVVGAELAVSAMLSSLVRRNICPNFVLTRRVFTCPYEPPETHWGSEENKKPKGGRYSPTQSKGRKPREPHEKHRSKYQYMRMELCTEGDAEEYLKRHPQEAISGREAQQMIFQIAFALHAAADRFSLKHYDLKLLNVFLQRVSGIEAEFTTLRYGLGSHIFALEMPTASAIIAKVADYGTANVQAESNGQPSTIGQFTTLENTPPEFMILGDAATQGHGHDAFGLGLCVLHLFTGHAPYEEILGDVTCPSGLKSKLERVWEDEKLGGYCVIRSVVLADVSKDEDGEVIEGEPDGTLYDTLYRYLVLFGIPDNKYKIKEHSRVWKAIISSLEGESKGRTYGRKGGSKKGPDAAQFEKDQMNYSVRNGGNEFISRARKGLKEVEGGMELLFSLVEFDPEKRATVCDVLNSQFMIPLREDRSKERVDDPSNHAMSFMAYATN